MPVYIYVDRALRAVVFSCVFNVFGDIIWFMEYSCGVWLKCSRHAKHVQCASDVRFAYSGHALRVEHIRCLRFVIQQDEL